ncbi:MAG: hypothetical protein GEV13_00845 [Rhodospirillales bacterium]|nr:hypothetical protein [Rhodospirillales bacterium]
MQPGARERAELIKRIERGEFRECYLIYNRKSSDDTDNQKNSIRYQKTENLRFAVAERLKIAPLTLDGFATNGIVSERHSGFDESHELGFGPGNTVHYRIERPKFHQLVQWLGRRCFRGVIILCWDRASRNRGDDTILRKLMKSGTDVRFVLARYDKSSAGALHMDVDGMFAEHHSRVTSEKVTLTKRNLRERGVCTHKAPVGYLNLGDMYRKPFDPARAPIIRQLFALAATGEWTLADLSRWAIKQGFTMPPVRRRRTEKEILAEEEDDVRLEIAPTQRLPTFNNIHKVLTNRFYTGRIMGNEGLWVRSVSHEALVSDQLFNQVQARLRGRQTSVHYAQVVDLPLRRLIYCADCGRVYTPYSQKGIVYYGARCAAGCTNGLKSINFDFAADTFGSLIGRLSFSDEEYAYLDENAGVEAVHLETTRLNLLEANARREKKIKEDLAYLRDNRLTLLRTGAYSAEGLVAEEEQLNLQLDRMREDAIHMPIEATINDTFKLSELIKSVAVSYSLANPSEKDQIVRVMFSELALSESSLSYQCKNGFRPLAARFLPNHDPKGWLSELCHYREAIQESIDDVESLIDLSANDNTPIGKEEAA